jgi:hypothetical protein
MTTGVAESEAAALARSTARALSGRVLHCTANGVEHLFDVPAQCTARGVGVGQIEQWK